MLCSRTLPKGSGGGPAVYAVLALGLLGCGAFVAVAPGVTVRVGLPAAAALLVAATVVARADRILDAGWVIVLELYLIGPVGALLSRAGLPLVMTPVVALAPLPFVATAFWTRDAARRALILLGPLCALWALAALSLLWSPDREAGTSKLVLSLLTGLVPAAWVLVLAGARGRVAWGLIAAVALVSAAGLIVFGVASPTYPGRPTLFDANPIWAARAIFIGALVALFGPFPRLARAAAVPVMVVAGLLTVSLGPFLGLVAGAWAGIGETLRCRPAARPALLAAWILVGAAVAALVLVGLTGAVEPASPLLSRVLDDPNATSRGTFLQVAAEIFARSPVLGSGLGAFASTGLDAYPHNLVAEIASELGVLGLAAVASWLVLALRGAAGSPLLVALLVASAVYTLGSGSMASNTEFWVISAVAAARLPVRAAADAGLRPTASLVPASTGADG